MRVPALIHSGMVTSMHEQSQEVTSSQSRGCRGHGLYPSASGWCNLVGQNMCESVNCTGTCRLKGFPVKHCACE
jgi:hypothetical protein